MKNIVGDEILVDPMPTNLLITDLDESIENLKLAKDDVTTVAENFLDNTCPYLGKYFEMAIMTTNDLAQANYKYIRRIRLDIMRYKIKALNIDKSGALVETVSGVVEQVMQIFK